MSFLFRLHQISSEWNTNAAPPNTFRMEYQCCSTKYLQNGVPMLLHQISSEGSTNAAPPNIFRREYQCCSTKYLQKGVPILFHQIYQVTITICVNIMKENSLVGQVLVGLRCSFNYHMLYQNEFCWNTFCNWMSSQTPNQILAFVNEAVNSCQYFC